MVVFGHVKKITAKLKGKLSQLIIISLSYPNLFGVGVVSFSIVAVTV